MKNKKSFRKAALPILCALLASVLSLTSVTYAWFTSGTQATVDTINVGVESAGGLQISLDNGGAFKWSSSVNPAAQIGDVVLTPVSTTGVRNGSKLDFFTASYNDTLDKIYDVKVAENKADEPQSWITFDLYFRNAETEAKIINLSGTTVKSPSGSSHYAARLAFLEQGTLSTLAANQTPGNINADTSKAAQIYEPNADEHTTAGKADYQLNKGSNSGKFEYYGIAAGSAQNTYYNRYTGNGFTEIKNRLEDGTGKYVFNASATTAEKFVAWNIEYDYTAVTLDAAADVYSSGGTVYTAVKAEEVITGFNAVEAGGELEKEVQYYVKSLATLYDLVEDTNDEDDVNNVLTAEAVQTVSEVTTYEADGETVKEQGMEITLAAQTITKVTIYIWLEGQDADCENSIASYSFNVDLKFDIKA